MKLLDVRHELGNLANILQGEADLMWRGKTSFAETRALLIDTVKRLKSAMAMLEDGRAEEGNEPL
jgi:hypothetical protein